MTNPNHTDASRSDDLVARLRRTYPDYYNPARASTGTAISPASMLLVRERLLNPDGPEAADRIEALEAENERLRGKVSQAILYLDDVAGLTENPLYNPLEVGFRHSPLSPKEREERYATACSAAWQSAQHGLAALGEKQ